jgi:CheY-like chemotaxis protein
MHPSSVALVVGLSLCAATALLQITVDAGTTLRPVAPRLFGTNLEPKDQSDQPVRDLIASLGLRTHRYPGGGWPGWHWQTGPPAGAPLALPHRRGSLPAQSACRARSPMPSRPQRQRIRNILLAGTPYDAFLMEEAGFRRREQPWPDDAPVFELVRTADETVEAVQQGGVDLLIIGSQLKDATGFEVRDRVRALTPALATVIVTSDNQARGVVRDPAKAPDPSGLFVWYGAPSVLRTLVRLQEDERNFRPALASTEGLAVLIVEDEPNFYSHYLPAVYERIYACTVDLLPRTARPRSPWNDVATRPFVILRHNFEDAFAVVARYSRQLLALITDIEYPMGGVLRSDAGLRLLYRARALQAHMPVVVQSHQPEHRAAVEEAGASFLHKGSNHLLSELGKFLSDFCGFGPFVFRWPAGAEFGRADNLAELRDLIARVPDVVFEHHGLHNDFSSWLAVHGYGDLAKAVRELTITETDVRARFLQLLDETLVS